MVEEKRPRLILMGDSIYGGDGNHFAVRYDENNKPNYWEINGQSVTATEFAARYPGQ